MYRLFTVKDTLGKTIKFKVWPNLAAPNTNKVVYEKTEIELTLPTNQALLSIIGDTNAFMKQNTINKLMVEEFEE